MRPQGTNAADVVRIGIVGAIAAIIQIALTIAYASLLFRDELAGALRLGLAAMFAGVVLAAAFVAVRSGFGGHVVSPQDSGLVVLSVVAPSIAASAGGAAGPTVIVLMGIGSAGVGVLLVLLGRFRLGRLVRYLPFPVLAGFMAGTGLVMGQGTIALAWNGLAGDATGGADRVGRLAVAGAVTLAMLAIARSDRPTERLMPTLVIGALVAVQTGRVLAGIGRVDGADRGWLLPVMPDGALMSRDWMNSGADADWGVVLEQLPALAPLLILAPLTLLLYLTALEASLDMEIDVDREFRTIGTANLFAGAAGSAVAYTQFANTMLVQRMGGPRRAIPLVIAAGAGVVLLTGDLVVALVPQPVVAGMLGFIAASFILDWTWDVRRRVSVVELGLALVIAASIPAFGFLVGVGIGLLLATAWFVVQYSQISGVRRVGDARVRRSNVERDSVAERLLEASGDRVVVLELDGYLFFGTGDAVARTIEARVGDDRSLDWVVFDLTRVTGADSSAAASFQQLVRRLERRGVEVVWCGLRPLVARSLGTLLDPTSVVADLDRALERTERARLDAERSSAVDHVGDTGGTGIDDVFVDIVSASGQRRTLAAGDVVLRRGETDRGLIVVESGRVSVLAPDGARLRGFGPGAVLGEIGMYAGRAASAHVDADTDSVIVELDREAVDELERRDPATAARLHRALAATLAERLVVANDALDDLRAADRHDVD